MHIIYLCMHMPRLCQCSGSGRIDVPPRLCFLYKKGQVQSHVEVLKNDEPLHSPIWANQLVAFKARAVVWFCLALHKAYIYALNSDSITIVTCSIHQRLVYFLLVFCQRSTFFSLHSPALVGNFWLRPDSAACRWYKKELQLKKQWRKSLVAVLRAWAPYQWDQSLREEWVGMVVQSVEQNAGGNN